MQGKRTTHHCGASAKGAVVPIFVFTKGAIRTTQRTSCSRGPKRALHQIGEVEPQAGECCTTQRGAGVNAASSWGNRDLFPHYLSHSSRSENFQVRDKCKCWIGNCDGCMTRLLP